MEADIRSILESFQKEFPDFDVKKARRLIEEMRIAVDAVDLQIHRILHAIENGGSETIDREYRQLKSVSNNLSKKLDDVRAFEKAIMRAANIVQGLCEQMSGDQSV